MKPFITNGDLKAGAKLMLENVRRQVKELDEKDGGGLKPDQELRAVLFGLGDILTRASDLEKEFVQEAIRMAKSEMLELDYKKLDLNTPLPYVIGEA